MIEFGKGPMPSDPHAANGRPNGKLLLMPELEISGEHADASRICQQILYIYGRRTQLDRTHVTRAPERRQRPNWALGVQEAHTPQARFAARSAMIVACICAHVEFFLVCMCMVLQPRACFSCMAYSTHAQCCSRTSCLL